MTMIPTPDMERVVAALAKCRYELVWCAAQLKHHGDNVSSEGSVFKAIDEADTVLQLLRQHADAPARDVEELVDAIETQCVHLSETPTHKDSLPPKYYSFDITKAEELITAFLTAQPDTRREGEHSWVGGKEDYVLVCENCGVVKRERGKNKPCPSAIAKIKPTEGGP